MVEAKEYKIIKISKKNKKYLVSFENSDIEYTLTEDQIVEFRIIVGNALDEKAFKKLNKSISETTLYNKTIHYIDFKPRTEKEVIKYLKDQKAEDTTIKDIIKKLIKINYLNDERYAKSFVNESIRKQKGKNYIKQTLQDKGIEINLIQIALEEYEYSLEIENALIKAQKLVKNFSKYPIKKQKQKINEKLYIDGFGYDIINYAINKIKFIDESDELLEKEYNRLVLKGFDNNKIIQKLLAKGYDYTNIKKML